MQRKSKPKVPKPRMNLLPLFDDLASVSVYPSAKRLRPDTTFTSETSSSSDFLNLDTSFGSGGSSISDGSFLSTSPALFEDEPLKIPIPRRDREPGKRKSVTFNETVAITPLLSQPSSQPPVPFNLPLQLGDNGKNRPPPRVPFTPIWDQNEKVSHVETEPHDYSRKHRDDADAGIPLNMSSNPLGLDLDFLDQPPTAIPLDLSKHTVSSDYFSTRNLYM